MLIPILCFAPMAVALLCYAIGGKYERIRDGLVWLTGICVFAASLLLWQGDTRFSIPDFCGMGLTFHADGFRSLYATIASFMWMISGLYSPEYFAHHDNRRRYYLFNLLTLGATLGVLYSDDLYTTLIFFEVMSFTSYVWVAQEETEGALRAGGTYLAVAIIGGLTTLMGLFLLYHQAGTLSFNGLRALYAEGNPSVLTVTAAWLTLTGFAAKAGLFPLHIWLPKAHPVAPAPASALLSGILTKSGVFGLLVVATRILPGNRSFGLMLLGLAIITMFVGALLALFSVDLKRTLACSSMSQIGFITVGIAMMVLLGEEGTLPAYGTILHMVNHSLIKLVLFLCAGVVYQNLHHLNLNDIRGFGRKKPLLHFAFLMGALSIGCIPPIGSGFNSKSLLHEGILEYIALLPAGCEEAFLMKGIEILFLISGGLTIAYMTKLYICLFWQKHATCQAEFDGMRHYLSPIGAVGILFSAIILPVFGLLGAQFMTPLAQRSLSFLGLEDLHHAVHYFSSENLLGAAESIAIGVAVYLGIVRPFMITKQGEYVDRWPAKLDLENGLYRPIVLHLLPDTATVITRGLSEMPERVMGFANTTVLNPLQDKPVAPVGNAFTYNMGRFTNAVSSFFSRALRLKKPLRTDFEYIFDAAWRELVRGVTRISRSISFGLMLLVIGLFGTVLYLLLH